MRRLPPSKHLVNVILVRKIERCERVEANYEQTSRFLIPKDVLLRKGLSAPSSTPPLVPSILTSSIKPDR